MIAVLKFLGLAMKYLPWLPFGKKVIEETVESIQDKELPTKEEFREIVETLPGVPTKKAG